MAPGISTLTYLLTFTKSLKICYFFNISQEHVYRTKISDVDELKQRINSEWVALSRKVTECSVWQVA